MKRSAITRRTPLRAKPKGPAQPRERRLPAVPAVKPEPRAVMARCAGAAEPQPKNVAHRDQRIRDSARDEQCLVRLPGCIGHEPGATIWSHYRGSAGGKGLSLKAADVCGCYACTACDAVWDGQRPRPAGMTPEQVALAWHEGHIRSLGRLHAKGLL